MRTVVAAIVLAGRRIQPAAFAITLAALSIGLTWWGTDRVAGPWETAIGAAGISTATLLTIGWAGNWLAVMRAGLLASCVLWPFVAWVALTGLGSLTSGLLALAWAVLAGGSYWLEEVEAQYQRRRRTGAA
jgi:hypothetical protein